MKGLNGALMVGIATILCACGDHSVPAAAHRTALTVTVAAPVSTVWPRHIQASGNVAAWQESVIGSDVNGVRLDQVFVNVGDVVRKGQLLALFNQDTTRAEHLQAEAVVQESEANAALAHDQAVRAVQLEAAGTLSHQDLVQFLAAEQMTAAKLEAARAQMQMQRLRLQYTRIVAPDDGVISSRSATVGAVPSNAGELFRLIRQGRLEWHAEVSADDLARIAPGAAADIQLPGAGIVRGRVRASSPVVDPDTRTGRVFVDLPAPGALKAGMYVAGTFVLPGNAALHVPESALVYRDGYQYVVAVSADNRVRQIKVVTGRRDGHNVEILDGLMAAARIVVSGAGFLSDGDTVRIR